MQGYDGGLLRRFFSFRIIIDDIFNDASSGGTRKTGPYIEVFMFFSVRVGAIW